MRSMQRSSYLPLSRRLAALLIVPISLLLPVVANAETTTTFLQEADARVEQDRPTTRLGGLMLKTRGGSSPIRTYLKFSPSGLSDTVVKATLSIVPLNASSGFEVHETASSSWEKETITWSNAPPMTSTPIGATGPYACCGRVEVDVTELVTGNGAVSMGLTSTSFIENAYKNIDWERTAAPQLVVTTAPAPTASSTPTATAGDTTVSLTWGASSDMSDVAGYHIYREGRLVGRTTETSYTDTDLTNGTSYSYHVVAHDSAGATISSSAMVSATPMAFYYVSNSGSDGNPGTSASPWRTLGHAASLAEAGSTVVARAGAYAEDVTLRRSGTRSSPITFRADNGANVSLRSLAFAASHLVLSGITISAASRDCVTLAPALTNITVSDGRITNCGRDGIRFTRTTTQPYTSNVTIKSMAISRVGLSSSSGNNVTIYGNDVKLLDSDLSSTPNDAINAWGDAITIRRNLIHDISNTNANHNDALQSWTSMDDGARDEPLTNLVFAENTVRNVNGSHAHVIMAEGPEHRDWRIYGNVIQNIGDQSFVFGISGESGIANVDVYNNTFVNAGAHNTMEFNGRSSGRLANNIFYNCAGWGGSVPYWVGSSASVARHHNLAGGTTKPLKESGDVNANPAFVNPWSDFRLTAPSPAIDAGDDGLARTADRDGKPANGIVDIGAYEY